MPARKPESQFSSSVNKLLPLGLHYEKMNNPYRGGTADFWYSGNKADLWVEYKWLPSIPKRAYNLTDGAKPSLSMLQQKWLADRVKEGRNIAVIIGTPIGVIILTDLAWEKNIDFTANLVSRKEAALWLYNQTMFATEHTNMTE
jgi:hypothetical protein